MKKLILAVFLVASTLLTKPQLLVADNIEPTTMSVDQQIDYFSSLYGGDSRVIKRVMQCESNGDHSTVGDGGLSNGIFQFQKPTFNRMEKVFGEDLDYESQYDQVKLGVWALSNPKYAKEWTTYVAIQNGGEYTFYSKQLKKHFVVKC